jgi:dTDP-glucose 4,6-dehydratase
MKTALVTGGAGFLGSHLCTFLLERGFRVICIDNLITGKASNVAHLLDHPDFVYIEHDITTPFRTDENIHYVLHFASPASPIDYQRIPIQTLLVGSLGTQHLLDLAKEKNAVFFLAGTSEVYGDPLVSPQPETYWGNVNPVGPRSCYDEAKRYAEALTMAYHRVHGVDTKIIRIFNTYGSRMRRNDGRVIPAFVTQALNGQDITVFGDGSQTRSFCYVADLITGIYALLMSAEHGPINVGNPREYTILELAKKIIALTGSSSTIAYKPLPEDDPKRRKPDITLAQQKLQWKPTVELDEGLQKTIAWFKEDVV